MRDGGAEAHHPGLRDHAGGRFIVAAAGSRRSPGAGNRDRRRAHIVHHIKDRLSSGCQSVEGPGGFAMLLLSGTGSQMPGVLADRTALQN